MAYALEAAAVERESPPQDPRQRRGEGEAGASQSVVGWGGGAELRRSMTRARMSTGISDHGGTGDEDAIDHRSIGA
jgi:hypothetical protein